ncbi:hypothetical protein GCM10009555_002810 [Acrocarpospora macrocephala]|uniref:Alpha/beta hydrolase fold-3 domain-containing protein n=1 Tax=Acrocarpospora macrocephala TaxID=150177 RepID=A0A5M3WTD1_9ACTN|nr:alpha/beta hydrolase [Acrocarpospora macrocephala]GES11756.1 hypothetical protein Amac_053530 [Acrocarpospora macrocephala]
MRLHPVLRLVIPAVTRRLTRLSRPSATERPAKSAEAAYGRLVQKPPVDVTVTTLRIPRTGEGGDIEARVYRPGGPDKARAALVYFHGGGWWQGSLETSHSHCAHLAKLADAVVISVAYRLIPEHPFPANLRDCYTAFTWTVEHAGHLGVDPSLIAVGGTSSGANLAAAVALRARDEDGPAIALQLLEIPVLDITAPPQAPADAPSWYHVMVDQARQTFDRYAGSGARPDDPLVSPLLAESLQGLPPTVILANELDVVVDHAVRYADRLREAAVPVTLTVYPGLAHGMQAFTRILPVGRRFRAEAARALSASLRSAGSGLGVRGEQ